MNISLAEVALEADMRARCRELAEIAAYSSGYYRECGCCSRKMFFVSAPYALIPGHVYSREGEREARRNAICEWCFDRLFMEEEWESNMRGVFFE